MLIGAMVEFSPDAALAQNGEGILGPHGNVITGKKEFIEYCAQCHGMDATGDGPIAPDLKERPADLTQLVPKNGGVFAEQGQCLQVWPRRCLFWENRGGSGISSTGEAKDRPSGGLHKVYSEKVAFSGLI